jgi:CNT family concentrative nucleoside transporter
VFESTLIIIIASLAVGYTLFLFSAISKFVLIITTIFLILSSILKGDREFQRISGALFIISGTTLLISHGLYGKLIFQKFSEKVAYFLSLSDYGAQFLFGHLADATHYFPGPDANWPGFGFQFAFKVLPTIVFFGGFMSVLYYFGIMQKVIQAMSRFMRWTIGTPIAIYPARTPPAMVAKPPTIIVRSSDFVIFSKNGLISKGASV